MNKHEFTYKGLNFRLFEKSFVVDGGVILFEELKELKKFEDCMKFLTDLIYKRAIAQHNHELKKLLGG